MEVWHGQKHLQAPLNQPESQVQERKRKAQEDQIRTLWSLFPQPPSKTLAKRRMTSGLFSNILGNRIEAKLKDKTLALSMLMAEAEMLERICKSSFSKILSPTIIHHKLQPNQKPLDDQDFDGNFPQMLAPPGKRGMELGLGEVGPGRGLFSNILSRVDGKQKRAQGVKSLFTNILR